VIDGDSVCDASDENVVDPDAVDDTETSADSLPDTSLVSVAVRVSDRVRVSWYDCVTDADSDVVWEPEIDCDRIPLGL